MTNDYYDELLQALNAMDTTKIDDELLDNLVKIAENIEYDIQTQAKRKAKINDTQPNPQRTRTNTKRRK